MMFLKRVKTKEIVEVDNYNKVNNNGTYDKTI